MGTVDYYINDGFYSGENADQVTNRNSNDGSAAAESVRKKMVFG